MNKTWIVTWETYLRQIKSWSFLSLVLMPFLFVALTFGVSYFATPNQSENDIAVVSSTPQLRQTFLKQSHVTTTTKYATLQDAGGQRIRRATGGQAGRVGPQGVYVDDPGRDAKRR